MKQVTRLLNGMIFWPQKRPEVFFPSLHSWIKNGAVDNAWIYDSADTLFVAGVPIVDAYMFRGVWHRQPIVPSSTKSVIRLHRSLVVSVAPPQAKVTLEGIKVTNPKQVRKMVY